jgi:membrane protease subunit HflK
MAQQQQIDWNDLSPRKIGMGFLVVLGAFAVFSSFYTIDANEQGVVTRLGAFSSTNNPGLHFKLPFGIDKVYKVKVDYLYKMEFGFRTEKADTRTRYDGRTRPDESWMLTGDLNMAEVEWVVQYKVKDPVAFLFNVKNVENTIRDVSEASMRLMIGDRSFQEVLQAERKNINNLAWSHIQEILDSYNTGIAIQLVQLQNVFPPDPVEDSFNEVNRAKQEQEEAINQARQAYNKEIYRAEGEAERLITEASGYAIERVNNAKGDVELFNAVLKEYKKAPQITRDRLYLETMEKIYRRTPNKVIVDKRLNNLLPLLNLNK